MIILELQEIAEFISGELIGLNGSVATVSTDTRKIGNGDLYVALKGERFDGNDYILEAKSKGAAAAIVERYDESIEDFSQIVVDDGVYALGKLAQLVREKSEAMVIAITGTNGKTTVKEMVSSILSERAKTLSTEKNFNNEVGLPLTILRAEGDESYFVLEMGAAKKGDIEYLSNFAKPDISVITNVSAAHLQGFGNTENVAHTKGEIFSSLREGGVAVINRDDRFFEYWQENLPEGREIITFGFSKDADVSFIESDSGHSSVTTPIGQIEFELNLSGKHNLKNAMAAIAVAISLGISASEIIEGLRKVQPVNGRLNFKKGINGSLIIDDSYNSNPASLIAGLNVLLEQEGEKWFLFGDMGELGESSEELHSKVAEYARECGVSRLFAIGEKGRIVADQFGQDGKHYENREELAADLKKKLSEKVCLLVKGSRFMKLDEIVDSISENYISGGTAC